MQIIFESRDADGNQMRDMSVHRVRFALRRLSALVPRAKVQFSDVNGPRGGVDKRCQVELSTDAKGTVVIASLASDWRTADTTRNGAPITASSRPTPWLTLLAISSPSDWWRSACITGFAFIGSYLSPRQIDINQSLQRQIG